MFRTLINQLTVTQRGSRQENTSGIPNAHESETKSASLIDNSHLTGKSANSLFPSDHTLNPSYRCRPFKFFLDHFKPLYQNGNEVLIEEGSLPHPDTLKVEYRFSVADIKSGKLKKGKVNLPSEDSFESWMVENGYTPIKLNDVSSWQKWLAVSGFKPWFLNMPAYRSFMENAVINGAKIEISESVYFDYLGNHPSLTYEHFSDNKYWTLCSEPINKQGTATTYRAFAEVEGVYFCKPFTLQDN